MTVRAQLPQILIRNSFNILGLSSSSSLKEIRKRSQELLQLAKIEEVKKFDIDIGHIKEFRTECEIRLALERISGIQERLKEIFFWFEDHQIESLKAIKLISNESYEEAIAIFQTSHSEWLNKKNLALSLFFYAFSCSSLDIFCKSLDSWKLIFNSDEFWKFYQKYYLLHDELGTSLFLFEEFRGSIYEYLSAIAISFYRQTKNAGAIGACYSVFGKIGKTTDLEVLQPLILQIIKEMGELEKMKDNKPDTSSIKKVLEKIHKYFSELDKFELAEYSPLIILKNDTAEKLKSIAVAIYNETTNTEIAIMLLNESSNLAILENLLEKIESDKKIIIENAAILADDQQNKKQSSRYTWISDAKPKIDCAEKTVYESEICVILQVKIDLIKDFIYKHEIEKANSTYQYFDNELCKEATHFALHQRIDLLLNYCTTLIKIGHELFEKRKFGIKISAISSLLNFQTKKRATLAFKYAVETLENRLFLFDFLNSTDKAKLLKKLDHISSGLEICELLSFIELQRYYLKSIEIAANGQPENTRIAVKLLGEAICSNIFYSRFEEFDREIIWKYLAWGAPIAFFFFLTNSWKSLAWGALPIALLVIKSSQSFTYREET